MTRRAIDFEAGDLVVVLVAIATVLWLVTL
jgi:hypothetical protein